MVNISRLYRAILKKLQWYKKKSVKTCVKYTPMNFWGGVLFLLPTVFSLSITGGRSNVARLLDSDMGLDSVATSPWVRDKWLEISLPVRYKKKFNTALFLKFSFLLSISVEDLFYLFIF